MGKQEKRQTNVDTSMFTDLIGISAEDVEHYTEYYGVYVNVAGDKRSYLVANNDLATKKYKDELANGVTDNYIHKGRVYFERPKETKIDLNIIEDKGIL